MSGYTTGTGNRITSDGTYNYAYSFDGYIKSKTRISDGQKTTYKYDYRQRLRHITVEDSLGTLLKELYYRYDVFDRRIQRWVDDDGEGPNPRVVEWTLYDGDNPYMDLDNSSNVTNRYLYGPAVDFLLARRDNAGDEDWYLTDNLGSVRQIADTNGTVIHTTDYDAYGNQTVKAEPGGNRTTYTWDFENRLTKVQLPSGTLNTYVYDGDGKRVEKQDSAGTVKHIWDGERILSETDGAGATQVVYSYHPSGFGNLLHQWQPPIRQSIFDAMGNVVKLGTNSTVAVISDTYA